MHGQLKYLRSAATGKQKDHVAPQYIFRQKRDTAGAFERYSWRRNTFWPQMSQQKCYRLLCDADNHMENK